MVFLILDHSLMVQRPPFSKFISLVSNGDEVVLTLDDILLCEHSNKKISAEYFHVALLMCCINTGSKFWACGWNPLTWWAFNEQPLGMRANQNGYHELFFFLQGTKKQNENDSWHLISVFVLSPLTMPRHLDAPNRYWLLRFPLSDPDK